MHITVFYPSVFISLMFNVEYEMKLSVLFLKGIMVSTLKASYWSVILTLCYL